MQLISFGGQQLVRPGAYSTVNVKTNTPHTPGAFKVLAVIGSGTYGEPATPLYFNTPSLAAQKIGGTDALLAAQIAWEHGADMICFSLIDTAAQATYAVKSTDATPVTLATLNGLRWSADDNSITITVAAPTGSAPNQTQVITIHDGMNVYADEKYTVADSATGWTNFISQVNAQSNLVQAVAGPGGSTSNIAATVGTAASFTGGSRSASTTTTISNAINALQTEDVQAIITTQTDSTTQSAIFTHCNTMSDVNHKRERRAFFGQALATTAANYVTAMQAFATSNRVTMAAPGIYKNVNGANTLLSSAFTAAAIAGMFCGNASPANPLTFKFINANGLEYNYLYSDLQTLIPGQITPIEKVPNRGYRIVHALTSDTTGTNLVELSVADLVDVMARSAREQLETQFVGKASYTGVVNDVFSKTQSILEAFKKQGWIVDGTDANGQPLPAYRNITVSQSGTQYSVTYDVAPSLPINYITQTISVNA